MNKQISGACLVVACSSSWAYEPITHEKLSQNATETSLLSVPATISRLGLIGSFTGGNRLLFPDSAFVPKNIQELIGFGSVWEDDLSKLQATRHFFNPRNGQGLTGTLAGLALTGEPSPYWAIDGGTGDPDPRSGQAYSYKRAKDYLYNALTSPFGPGTRAVNWGLTFQTLGHVIHHLQDMAQPQHVRNDTHCDALLCKLVVQPLSSGPIFSASLYEKWVQANSPTTFGGYAPVNNPSDPFQFKLPKQFWSTGSGGDDVNSGRGIAEYTQRGFLSAGTLNKLAQFPSPNITTMTATATTLEALCAEQPADDCKGKTGKVTQYGNMVTDTLRGTNVFNERAVSASVFDQELQLAGAQPIYALNRFNLRAMRDILIPRAVAYSVGMINYFFRGNIEISRPDEGVYSIVDHSTNQGFRKIKLKLTAPANDLNGNPQSLSAGKLVAVLKFRRNRCWQNDLTGYAPFLQGGDNFENCRGTQEEIVVSGPANGGADVALSSDPKPFTFEFATELPLSATDVLLQVVYRGKLGEEEGAVVVTTQDIGEPTFFSYTNASDYYTLDVNGVVKAFTRSEINDPERGLLSKVYPQSCVDYTLAQPQLRPTCLNPFDIRLGLNVGGGAAVPATKIEIDALPPQRLMRIAFLGNAGADVVLAHSNTNTCYPQEPFKVSALEWQVSYDGSGTVLKYPSLRKVRGVAQWYGTSCVGNATNQPPGAPDNRNEVMSILEDKTPIAVKINGDAGF